ncbi:NADH-ubiquinone oxidoreductase subunit 3 [Pokkaliibacter plantistimulans]|uniref:NADH-ubiquinone oxidoreductase subunit 3 n=1 Tax=Pokkaliibacter plantistimulans TaxID=1635171 RepID=A0ABX5LW96_9GAMM|nr:nitroreductase family protein [Pokkaliibacter plantistimulans]PXF30934.1 NADH-ubiquinone oxidoreductase subunit 3 [Pokkaliibacter plantistimulans]
MNASEPVRPWTVFQAANRFRRVIRDFSPTPIPEQDVRALLTEAALAPSSGNLQPYQFHWLRDPSIKARVAQACNGQKAAMTAAELIVVVASPELGRQTALAQLEHIDTSDTLEQKFRDYHRAQIGKFQKILGLGGSVWWWPLVFIAGWLRPSLSLLPVGHIGSRHWAARNATFAAQTLMLGAAAKGIDSCPMEGFSAPQVAKILGLPRGSVVPLVIALGYRADSARIEQRWRREEGDVVITH